MKNKKLLLTALLSVFMLGSAYAQFAYSSSVANIGQTYSAVTNTNKDTLITTFNQTGKAVSFSLMSKKYPLLDSVVLNKTTTNKGVQCVAYIDSTRTGTPAVQYGSFKCASLTGTGNPVHVSSMASLLDIRNKMSLAANSTVTGSYAAADSLTTPAHCIFDVAGSVSTPVDQVYGMYPGRYKHLEYGFAYNFAGKTVTDDVTFDMSTYDLGTTGKTASYDLLVYASTGTLTIPIAFGNANLLGIVKGFYTTATSGLNPVHVNLAAAIGKLPSDLSNKYVYIVLRTQGTANASSVVDGLPNGTSGLTHVPTAYDPTITFDNFTAYFASPIWSAPTGAVANVFINYNAGTPVVTTSTDVTYGNAVNITPVIANAIPFRLKDTNRGGAIKIFEDAHIPAYSFAATGAVMANDGAGNYNVPVTYAYVPSDGVSNFSLTIPAPAAGTTVNDDLEVTVIVTKATVGNTIDRLEVDNGVRFYYNFSATAVATALNSATTQKVSIYSVINSIIAKNATENVVIYSIDGQKIKIASAAQAAIGIAVNSGLYIVKTGNSIQKVLVK